MRDIIKRYDRLDGEMRTRCHKSTRPQVVASLVVASVIQEAGENVAAKLQECIREMLYR